MKYVTYSLPDQNSPRVGALRGTHVIDVARLARAADKTSAPATMIELIQAGPAVWKEIAGLVDNAMSKRPSNDVTIDADAVRWHAPIPRPAKNVFCLGLNYLSHIKETSGGQPAVPL